MNETYSKANRIRRYSLRFLLGIMTLAAILFALIGYRNSQLKRHTAAISFIEECGGRVTLTQWKGSSGKVLGSPDDAEETLMSRFWATPSVSGPLVDLSGSSLSAEELRSITPHLRSIIPRENENEVGKTYVAVILTGNPNATPELVNEMREALPNCEIMYSPQQQQPAGGYAR